jgi:hypothetical protein
MYQLISTTRRLLLSASLFGVGVAALVSSNALAANCEDFTVWLRNETLGLEIKATKFEYKDGSKWKTENLLGVDGYEIIDVYQAAEFKRNLQGVGSESTQFRVTYKLEDGYTTYGFRKWGDDKIQTISAFTCRDNGTRSVRLFTSPVSWQ